MAVSSTASRSPCVLRLQPSKLGQLSGLLTRVCKLGVATDVDVLVALELLLERFLDVGPGPCRISDAGPRESLPDETDAALRCGEPRRVEAGSVVVRDVPEGVRAHPGQGLSMRAQARHKRSMKLAAASRRLGQVLGTVGLLVKRGDLDVDLETGSSGARSAVGPRSRCPQHLT